jgi:hypothetical protein
VIAGGSRVSGGWRTVIGGVSRVSGGWSTVIAGGSRVSGGWRTVIGGVCQHGFRGLGTVTVCRVQQGFRGLEASDCSAEGSRGTVIDLTHHGYNRGQ